MKKMKKINIQKLGVELVVFPVISSNCWLCVNNVNAVKKQKYSCVSLG